MRKNDEYEREMRMHKIRQADALFQRAGTERYNQVPYETRGSIGGIVAVVCAILSAVIITFLI